ncbi:sensor histidine kinase [Haliovirga abyssi]|uniref:histidine kinase n=1 Tax=Haliovirga abyssi TaxID=2996794 RepID=A0AAU9D5Q7_9FUSO|nr:histidine kinase N-terminal 7TM domain-containing protein [Haliovirga abyssi]BDU51319.1 hypothetical protein HLVA_18880 [Haliovirga abyssi]
MNYNLKLEIFYIEFWHILFITLSLGAIFYLYLKSKKSKLLYSFIYLQLLIIVWMIAKILKTVSYNVNLRWFFIVMQYFAVSFIGVAFLEFAYIYLHKKIIKKKLRLFIYIFPILQIITVITNPWHHLFYKTFTFYSDSFGILFYLYLFIEYLMIFIGIFWCAKKLKNSFYTKTKKELYLISTAILFPFLFNFIYISGLLKNFFYKLNIRFVFDITPLSFTISLLIFVYIIFNYEFLDVIPILKENIIKYVDSAIILTDKNFQIIEINNSAKELFDIYNVKIDNFRELYFKMFDKNPKLDEVNVQFTELNINNKKIYFEVKSLSILDNSKNSIGTIFNITDTTDLNNLKSDLELKNKTILASNKQLKQRILLSQKISEIKVSNLVARELHDILGHSLTLVINLLESSKIYFNKNRELSNNLINESIKILNLGYNDLKKSLNNKVTKEKNSDDLKEELLLLINRFKQAGLNIKFSISGENTLFCNKKYTFIKKICQEALTNSLKYSDTKAVFLSVKFKNKKSQINIIDSGKGCDNIIKGTGLNSMEYRVKEFNGTFNYTSEKNQGFIIYAEL